MFKGSIVSEENQCSLENYDKYIKSAREAFYTETTLGDKTGVKNGKRVVERKGLDKDSAANVFSFISGENQGFEASCVEKIQLDVYQKLKEESDREQKKAESEMGVDDLGSEFASAVAVQGVDNETTGGRRKRSTRRRKITKRKTNRRKTNKRKIQYPKNK
jgi:hypothetical protein